MSKTNKSFTKRLKVTRNKKLVARRPGQNHFNAKESQAGRQHRRRTALFELKNKARGRFLSSM
jgi:ribosomal protein L35